MIATLAEWMLLGVFSHLTVFIHGELNNYAGQIASTFTGSFGLLVAIEQFRAGLIHGIAIATAYFGAYQLGLISSIVVYRVYFHRLRDFPGPRIMSMTQLWAVYKAAVMGRTHAMLVNLHREYGDFVRVGRQTTHERLQVQR